MNDPILDEVRKYRNEHARQFGYDIYDDILHYQKIIVALTETDRIMKEIDRVGVE